MAEAIHKNTVQFLKDLAKNNDRDWFNTHKDRYLLALENMTGFADEVIREMNSHDDLANTSGKKSLYRIYNDVRFSKNKLPYSAKFAFGLQRATKVKRGGYYVHIKPGASFIACGFFAPNPEDLKRIRQDIEINYKDWNKLLNSKGIKTHFASLEGDKVATSPKGFSIDHPAIELLRHKQFLLRHDFTDKEVLAVDFGRTISKIFKSVRPFFNHMSEVLTTDLNGESII